MLPDRDGVGRPPQAPTAVTSTPSDCSPHCLSLADVDALADDLTGRFAVQVVIDAERDHRRTHIYRSAAAAERAVRRANERGQVAHVTVVQMLPIGVVVGLGGGR